MTPAQIAHLSNPQTDEFIKHREKNTARALPFQLFDDITSAALAKRWLFKGIMARGETSAWIAPPGGMKSALMAEAAICAASGADWHGHRCKEQAGVIYFALERADLVKRRIQAHRERLGLSRLPIAIVASTINLLTPKTVPVLVATIREAEICFGVPAALVIFDTFAKLIAAGGGDEDKAKDQGLVFANIQRIKEAVDAHYALVGHTGKDTSRGARGSNAILGDADVMATITGETTRTAAVIKANEIAEGPLFSFTSELHQFGLDEDGDPITVNIVSPAELATAPAAKMGHLPKAATIALRALADAINDQGELAPSSGHIPSGVRVVTADAWRQQAYRMGISTSEEERAKQQAFKRASEQLIGSSRVGFWDGQVWLTS
jgi:hypothetical protein